MPTFTRLEWCLRNAHRATSSQANRTSFPQGAGGCPDRRDRPSRFLEKAPELRFQTAAELRATLADVTATAQTAGSSERISGTTHTIRTIMGATLSFTALRGGFHDRIGLAPDAVFRRSPVTATRRLEAVASTQATTGFIVVGLITAAFLFRRFTGQAKAILSVLFALSIGLLLTGNHIAIVCSSSRLPPQSGLLDLATLRPIWRGDGLAAYVVQGGEPTALRSLHFGRIRQHIDGGQL